jgi:hypothetical protein
VTKEEIQNFINATITAFSINHDVIVDLHDIREQASKSLLEKVNEELNRRFSKLDIKDLIQLIQEIDSIIKPQAKARVETDLEDQASKRKRSKKKKDPVH